MSVKVQPSDHENPVPSSGACELVAVRINRRRNGQDESDSDCTLFQHNPTVRAVSSAGLVAQSRMANGSTSAVRLDQSTRYRLFQFDGSKALPYEESVGMALEGELGADVHIAGQRPIFVALTQLQPAKVRAFAAELAAMTGGDVVSASAQEQLTALMVAISNLGLRAAEDVRDDGAINQDHTARVQAVVEAARPFMAGHALQFYRRNAEAPSAVKERS